MAEKEYLIRTELFGETFWGKEVSQNKRLSIGMLEQMLYIEIARPVEEGGKYKFRDRKAIYFRADNAIFRKIATASKVIADKARDMVKDPSKPIEKSSRVIYNKSNLKNSEYRLYFNAFYDGENTKGAKFYLKIEKMKKDNLEEKEWEDGYTVYFKPQYLVKPEDLKEEEIEPVAFFEAIHNIMDNCAGRNCLTYDNHIKRVLNKNSYDSSDNPNDIKDDYVDESDDDFPFDTE